jgi:hypothetical protein
MNVKEKKEEKINIKIKACCIRRKLNMHHDVVINQ